MEYEKIKQLMDDMGNSKLSSIDIDFPDGTKISMKKNENVEISTKAMKFSSQEVKKEELKSEQSNLIRVLILMLRLERRLKRVMYFVL